MSKIAQLSIFTAFLFISGFIYVKFYQPESLKPVQATGRIIEIDMISAKGKWKFVPQAIRVKNGDTVLEHYSIADGNMPTTTGSSTSEIHVKVGDLVRIKIFNEDSFDHGFALEAFAINRRLFPNQETLVEFVASKAGASKFYCSVPCGEGHYQQVGTLVVDE